jgi:hypothetical protein
MSIKVEIEVIINRPIDEVFTELADIDKTQDWSRVILEIRNYNNEPVRVGTKFQQVVQMMGKDIEMETDVTLYEPPSSLRYEVKNPFPVMLHYRLHPENGSTKVNLSIETEPGVFFELAAPLVAENIKKLLEADLLVLKQLLDSRT